MEPVKDEKYTEIIFLPEALEPVLRDQDLDLLGSLQHCRVE
jgi:hypothetical protein